MVMDFKQLKEEKKGLEDTIEDLITEIEKEINQRIQLKLQTAVDHFKNRLLVDSAEEMRPLLKAIADQVSELLADLEKRSLAQVSGIGIERIDAGTMSDPHKTIIGDVVIQLAI